VAGALGASPAGALHLRQAMDLLELLHVRGTPNQLERLARASEGSPALLVELAAIIATEPLEDVLSRLGAQHLDVVDPGDVVFGEVYVDGQRVGAAMRELDIRVSAVSDELIRALAERPELMYDLRPRRFEELLAELFTRQGFEVELTKQTRDGGYDFWFVHHTPAGSLLTLVDAKRNRADRTVGVGVVRQLYGVVEATRATAGLVATTSFFSPEAKQFQQEIPFRLGLKDYFDLQTMLTAASRARV
jgi:restriction endonuclease